MFRLLWISILLAACFLATPALLAQDSAGSCNDCADCKGTRSVLVKRAS
jgi:hypothetical protein